MSLDALYRGFRDDYLDHEALTGQLRAWADAHPDLAHLESLGETPEGRSIWLLTVGPEPGRLRPAIWVDGNLHASEVAGSAVCLAIAERALRAHVEGPEDALDGILREVLVYVCPRISPDGAEAILETGRFVRSVPRDARSDRPRWVAGDVDGDGLSLVMRQQDPTGEFVESPRVPGLMVPRLLGDAGPAYKVYPEGTIAGFDGHTVPDPGFLADNYPDLNRNFPWDWRPEHEQVGAGPYPGSEPETRAVIAFATAHPNIFAWVNFHTFGGVFIRPLGDKPDSKMDAGDLALFRQLGHWAEELTGYPMVSGFEQFTYEPDRPLRGDLSEYAYRQRGAVGFVVELWDLFAQVGFERPDRFVDHYTHLDRADLEKLAAWDREHNHGRCLRPWRPFTHPQLGPAEVGGLDPRFGFWNPPPERLAEVCAAQVAMWRHVAALAPRVRLLPVLEPLEEGLARLTLRVENHGYLSTQVVGAAAALDVTEPLRVRIEATGCAVEGPPRAELGQLAGWGTGRFSGLGALYYTRSRGSGGRCVRTWTVRGHGTVLLHVGNARMGWRTVSVDT